MNRREFHQRLRFLLSREHPERMALLKEMTEQEQHEFRYVWRIHGRSAQIAPDCDWRTWLIMAGRGFGKTRAGAEWVRELAEAEPGARIALIGATLGEARSVMVEGESGILAVCPPGRGPAFEPSLRRLIWPNGAEATLYSAGEPESLRGPQHGYAWCDEVAKWDNSNARAMRAWDNLQFGLRLGEVPRCLATTTPRAVPLVRRLAALVDGQCWLVASGATGDWTGKAGQIAARQAGNWIFVAPRDGMRVLNRTTGQEIRYLGTWQAPTRPSAPSGGTTIDVEARAALTALLASLTNAGIIPAS